MFNDMTRSRLLQIWFTAAALVVVAGIALGASMTIGTAAILLALCLIPPAIVLKLWPDVPSQSIAQVLHDTEHRR
jgi:ABC-type glucose/galactose transport system permease subunit